jgi:hypothetical protein
MFAMRTRYAEDLDGDSSISDIGDNSTVSAIEGKGAGRGSVELLCI